MMSAVDLTSLAKQAALAEDQQQRLQSAKLEEMGDMDDFNPMWWLNDGTNENSSSHDTNDIEPPANSLLDDIVNGDMRRCYSENNLMQFESADVQAALVRIPLLSLECLLEFCLLTLDDSSLVAISPFTQLTTGFCLALYRRYFRPSRTSTTFAWGSNNRYKPHRQRSS